MPQNKLRMYLVMLPRLEAQERLASYQTLVASGELSMDEHARTRLLHELERAAEGYRRRFRTEETDIEAAGVPVVLEEGGS